MNKITILIADDHEMIRRGISAMLRTITNLEIVGEAINGTEAVAKTLELTPEIVFMDISMPELSGIEACRQILQRLPETKIIALSQHEDGEYVYQILKAGGSGYMLKNSSIEEFDKAIRDVRLGEKYFSAKISEIMINDLVNRKEKENDSDTPRFTLPGAKKRLSV